MTAKPLDIQAFQQILTEKSQKIDFAVQKTQNCKANHLYITEKIQFFNFMSFLCFSADFEADFFGFGLLRGVWVLFTGIGKPDFRRFFTESQAKKLVPAKFRLKHLRCKGTFIYKSAFHGIFVRFR